MSDNHKIMLALFLAAFTNVVSAQSTYKCECAWFVEEQFPGQIGGAAPIPLRVTTHQVEPQACNEHTAGNNTCKWLCDEWTRGINADGFSLCDAQTDFNDTIQGSARCFGGLYCGALSQDGRIPEDGLTTSIRTFYRMQECPDSTGHTEWIEGNAEYPEALCCNQFGFYDSCYDACACINADPNRYCECGVFAQVQFQAQPENSTAQPIPFRMVSSTVGNSPLNFCTIYAEDPITEECEAHCRPIGQSYFGNYTLLDKAYPEYNVRSWQNLSPIETHTDRLCCREDGTFEYPCPNQ